MLNFKLGIHYSVFPAVYMTLLETNFEIPLQSAMVDPEYV